VSCPNYLGEIVEWFGWALATWSFGGLAFALYTTANLAPRALDHHAWYRRQFPDYPADRRALLPHLRWGPPARRRFVERAVEGTTVGESER
jgi:protein-S-isoprenylcysteine O-methyltransferase Ste14